MNRFNIVEPDGVQDGGFLLSVIHRKDDWHVVINVGLQKLNKINPTSLLKSHKKSILS